LELGTEVSSEGWRLGFTTISERDVEKRRILEKEDKRRQIDKKIREQGKAKEEFSTADSHADPVLILLRDLDDDIGNLSEEVGRVQAQLERLESKIDELLESKSEQK
jgi:chaperonin cofactor prefoldin